MMTTVAADPATEGFRPHPVTGEPETQPEREARLRADTSPVTLRDIAAMSGRTEGYLQELFGDSVRNRRIADGTWPIKAPGRSKRIISEREATPEEIAAARVNLLDALPAPTGRDPDSGARTWPACDIWEWLRRTKRLTDWYEPKRLMPPGRAPG